MLIFLPQVKVISTVEVSSRTFHNKSLLNFVKFGPYLSSSKIFWFLSKMLGKESIVVESLFPISSGDSNMNLFFLTIFLRENIYLFDHFLRIRHSSFFTSTITT